MIRFKLTTDQPIERFKNLSPAVYAHTWVMWDRDDAFFWCEKHKVYFEEDESCPQCNPSQQLDHKYALKSRLFEKLAEIINHFRRKV